MGHLRSPDRVLRVSHTARTSLLVAPRKVDIRRGPLRGHFQQLTRCGSPDGAFCDGTGRTLCVRPSPHLFQSAGIDGGRIAGQGRNGHEKSSASGPMPSVRPRICGPRMVSIRPT